MRFGIVQSIVGTRNRGKSRGGLSIATLFLMFTLLTQAISLPHFNNQRKLYMEIYNAISQYQETDPVGDDLGKPELHPSSDHLAVGSHGMVSCDVPVCSDMGRDILKKGGNAADAAVTVALCIGSINSHSSGIGGGGYIVSSHANETLSIDAREVAPAKASKNMYDGMSLLSQHGGLAVAVPGELAGLHKLFTLHGSGKLSWADLFEPVIQLNQQGWEAPQIWVRAVHKINDSLLSGVKALKDSWDYTFKGDGTKTEVVDIGDHICRKNLAETLRIIARNGSAAPFYDPQGPIAPRLVDAAQKLGGVIDLHDFSEYSVNVKEALSFNFTHNGDVYELLTTKGASSGLALVAGLNFYTTLYNQLKEDTHHPISEMHRLIEAMKWAASARSHLGDVNSTYFNENVEKYSHSEWATDLLSGGKYSDNETFPWQHYEPLFEISGQHGTSHFSVVDDNGGAVGMTTTVNLFFGSSVYDNNTGIFLNNEMDDFSQPSQDNAFQLPPSQFNFIEPKKRPLSSMAPTILKKNGDILLIVGCAGGSRITTAILEAIVRTLYWHVPLLETIAAPRVHHQLLPEYVMVESMDLFEQEAKPYDMVSALKAKHHTFFESGALTAMNAIKRTGDIWEGVSDYWRKRGAASGY